MKRCANCSKFKPLNAFNRNLRAKDGLQSYCRKCASAYQKRMTRSRRSATGPKPIYRITKEQLAADIKFGLRNYDMAEKYGCSISTISRLRGKYHLRFGRHPEKKPAPPVKLDDVSIETLPPLSTTLPILELDMATFCRLARAARTPALIRRMRKGPE